jgi:prepilin peptidase CpaA
MEASSELGRGALRATPFILYAALLLAAVVSDVRSRRIPNALTAALALLGLVFAFLGRGPANVGTAFVALGVGLALWLPFYLIGLLGAGDVKLFAAGAAWLTPFGALRAAAFAALIGGVLGILWMGYARGAGFTLTRLGHAMHQPQLLREPLPAIAGRDGRVPYGVAMVAALLFETARLWRAG